MLTGTRYYLMIICGILLLAAARGFGQDNLSGRIERLQQEMISMRQEKVHLIAPSSFEKAEKLLQTARRELNQGGNINDIRKKIDETAAYLQTANRIAGRGKVAFSAVLKAREDALTAQAPEYAGETFSRAEDLFLKGSGALEQDDMKSAQNLAAESEQLYRQAELQAIRQNVMAQTSALLDEADKSKAKKYAPLTLQQARLLAGEALENLNSDRYNQTLAQETAAEAAYQALHAIFLGNF
ncbi:MAG: hypothetical protein WAN36_05615, partial [Calditrichia bacterium]